MCTERGDKYVYIETSPVRCWRSEVAGVSLATDTDTVADEEGADNFLSFVVNVLEEVELEVCPCNFTHVSPRALAK
jgi:hypothetical protein